MVSFTSAESRLRRARPILRQVPWARYPTRLPHLGEGRVPGSLLRFHNLVSGAVGVVGQESSRQIELHRNHRQVENVQIACNALALCFLRQPFNLGICTLQKQVGTRLLREGKVTEPEDHAV